MIIFRSAIESGVILINSLFTRPLPLNDAVDVASICRLAARSCIPLIFASFFGACDSNLRNPPPIFDHQDVPLAELHSEVISEEAALGLPYDIILVGPFLVVSDQAGEPFIHLFRREDGQHVLSFGRAGGGPGEFASAPRLLQVPGVNSTGFVAFDVNQGRFTSFDLRDPPRSLEDPVVTRLNTDRLVYNLLLLSENRAVGLGFFTEGRIALLDLETGAIEMAGAAPEPKQGEDHVPVAVLQHAYQATLGATPDGSRVAVALRRGSTIELFSSSGRALGSSDGPYPFAVDYVVDENGGSPIFRAGWMNRYGYVDLNGTTDALWGLFSGRSEEAYRREAWLAEYIHQYTWDGTFRRAYHLDRAVTAFTVVDDGSAIFAVTSGPEPAILRFTLPQR
ncbi:MAG: hypothetical protein H0X65_03665 [Gemmatimonadetes bacterium]|nr:hypothetical protein [Gemmatimonadota bacterium]